MPITMMAPHKSCSRHNGVMAVHSLRQRGRQRMLRMLMKTSPMALFTSVCVQPVCRIGAAMVAAALLRECFPATRARRPGELQAVAVAWSPGRCDVRPPSLEGCFHVSAFSKCDADRAPCVASDATCALAFHISFARLQSSFGFEPIL